MGQGYVTTLEVKPKSITLKRDDIKALCEIILKTVVEDDEHAYVRFTISGKKESVSSQKIEELTHARWPSKFNDLSFHAESRGNSIDLNLDSDGLMGYNKIVISSSDVDWVSARVIELENFISDHRNIHWLFQNWLSVVIQAIGLWILTLASMGRVFNIAEDNRSGVATLTVFTIMAIYYGLSKLYPFIFVDTGLPSLSGKIRKMAAFLLLAIVSSLAGALILKLV